MIPTAPQGEALVAVAVTLRPEWHAPGVRATLQKAGHLPAVNYLHALQALIRYATERTTDGRPVRTTPAFFASPGVHWDATKPGGTQAAGQPDAGPRCQDHATEPAATCRSCWGDVRAGMRSRDQVGIALLALPCPPVTPYGNTDGESDLEARKGRQDGTQDRA